MDLLRNRKTRWEKPGFEVVRELTEHEEKRRIVEPRKPRVYAPNWRLPLRTLGATCVLCLTAGSLVPLSFATTITPGGSVDGAAVVVSQTGSALASMTGAFSANTYTASYTESVIHDASNPFNASCGAIGCLTFLFQVSNSSGSANGIEHLTDGDGPGAFLNYDLNVGYETGSGRSPITIDETTYGTISFDFAGRDALAAGTATNVLAVQTSASQFTAGLFSAIDSSTDTVGGYVPAQTTASTPEPGSFLLLATGIAGVVSRVRRRRRA